MISLTDNHRKIIFLFGLLFVWGNKPKKINDKTFKEFDHCSGRFSVLIEQTKCVWSRSKVNEWKKKNCENILRQFFCEQWKLHTAFYYLRFFYVKVNRTKSFIVSHFSFSFTLETRTFLMWKIEISIERLYVWIDLKSNEIFRSEKRENQVKQKMCWNKSESLWWQSKLKHTKIRCFCFETGIFIVFVSFVSTRLTVVVVFCLSKSLK